MKFICFPFSLSLTQLTYTTQHTINERNTILVSKGIASLLAHTSYLLINETWLKLKDPYFT